jgi:hypothetical protein
MVSFSHRLKAVLAKADRIASQGASAAFDLALHIRGVLKDEEFVKACLKEEVQIEDRLDESAMKCCALQRYQLFKMIDRFPARSDWQEKGLSEIWQLTQKADTAEIRAVNIRRQEERRKRQEQHPLGRPVGSTPQASLPDSLPADDPTPLPSLPVNLSEIDKLRVENQKLRDALEDERRKKDNALARARNAEARSKRLEKVENYLRAKGKKSLAGVAKIVFNDDQASAAG